MSTDSNEARYAFNLTEAEVLSLLEDNSPLALVDITDKIAGAYSHQTLKSTENKAAEQIFRLLLRETELRVRVSLAQQVKDSDRIPRDIVMSLARDVEEVALPILQHSEILNDNDLVELINNTEEINRYIAISKRDQVSDVVTDTLLTKENDEVATVLVNNSGAQISEGSLKKIVEHYPTNTSLMNAVSHRPHLPVAVAEKLITVVSTSLASTLKQKYKLPTKDIEHEVEKTREGETLNLLHISHSQEDIEKLVNQLQGFDRLTPSIILSALCQGNSRFFETSLARLSNIPVSNARTLIKDRGDLGFRAIYNKSGLPDTMFPAVRLLLRVIGELEEKGEKAGSVHYANRIVENILLYSKSEPVENLSYIIALVRRAAQ